MIHLLKNKKGEFYWLSVVKKGNTFEENGKSSESYTSKQNCEKSARNEAGIFCIDPIYGLVDHTMSKVKVYTVFKVGTPRKWEKELDHRENIRKDEKAEIAFVQKLKK